MTAVGAADDLDALRLVAPALAVGVGCIIAGGLLAAVTAAAPSEATTWASAYLVLVAGVSQVGLCAGQALLAGRPVPRRLLLAGLLAWNAGNAAVLVGTLVERTLLVDAGGLLLVVALATALAVVRRPVARRRWILRLYRVLVAVLLVSIPVGLWLARLDGG